MIVMNSLPFKKFRKQLNERRYSGPEGTEEFKKLSPKLRKAINDVYNAINSTKGSIVSKIEGIISRWQRNTVSKKLISKIILITN